MRVTKISKAAVAYYAFLKTRFLGAAFAAAFGAATFFAAFFAAVLVLAGAAFLGASGSGLFSAARSSRVASLNSKPWVMILADFFNLFANSFLPVKVSSC